MHHNLILLYGIQGPSKLAQQRIQGGNRPVTIIIVLIVIIITLIVTVVMTVVIIIIIVIVVVVIIIRVAWVVLSR